MYGNVSRSCDLQRGNENNFLDPIKIYLKK